MNDAAWEHLTDAIDVSLGVTDHGHLKRPLEDRPDLTQSIEFFEFSREGQGYRLERATGPTLIDRKSHYSHRGGTANRIENIYDPNDIGHVVSLYKKVNDEWEPVDIHQLGL